MSRAASRRRFARRILGPTRALARQLEQHMREIALAIAHDELRLARKQDTDAERALLKLIRQFGLRQAVDAYGRVGGDVEIPATILRQVLAGKTPELNVYQWLGTWGSDKRARNLLAEQEARVRESVRALIADALNEEPTPSAGEIARRLTTQVHSPEGLGFSPERAAVIAQTELAQAENTGIVEGYKASGVTEMEWLAHSDGRSGDRHHERMDGVKIKVGERFETPLGNKLRYPGDPSAPIEDTVNCRCTTAPVFR